MWFSVDRLHSHWFDWLLPPARQDTMIPQTHWTVRPAGLPSFHWRFSWRTINAGLLLSSCCITTPFSKTRSSCALSSLIYRIRSWWRRVKLRSFEPWSRLNLIMVVIPTCTMWSLRSRCASCSSSNGGRHNVSFESVGFNLRLLSSTYNSSIIDSHSPLCRLRSFDSLSYRE